MARLCNRCGREVKMTSKFCPRCGNVLEPVRTENKTETKTPKFCPKCGKPLQAGASVCVGCGSPLRHKAGVNQPTPQTPKAAKKRFPVGAIVGIAVGSAAILTVIIIAGIIIALSGKKKPGKGGGTGSIPDSQVVADDQKVPSREELDAEYAAIDEAYENGTLFAEETEPYGHQSYEWVYDTESDWMQQEGVEEQLVV